MVLVSSKGLLLDAQKNGYAIGAFNFENMEMALAILAAAEEMKAPVILETTPGTLKFAPPAVYAGIAKAASDYVSVPVVLHLDHGNSFELAEKAMDAGYTSVMIDGSAQPFEENIRLSKAVVDAAHARGIPVETELGVIGGKGNAAVPAEDRYTDPDAAAEFAVRTGADSLAVAIGTAHGVYKTEPKIDVERLSKVREVVAIPLVMHGTSGVPEDVVAECVRRGICKVNYATDLRIAYTKGIRTYLQEDDQVFDPKKYTAAGMKLVTEYVKGKIHLLGCEGKA